MKSEVNWD